ncbi:MAG: hypothetical protein QOE24_2066 [Frankiales bacterium]|jgi:hypothetical protein|nr:hypothetical protein [Frankiales bacterium]MDX6209675.1 hypothetical protein [Frankiales bacterium]MDX6221239.1 hypothetical protein [Frankiales bacterium]
MALRAKARQLMTSVYVSMTTPGSDEGDVPGWVLITLMTAGLVAVLWTAAGDKLGSLLNTALDSVTPK